jgi:hypothetical protein
MASSSSSLTPQIQSLIHPVTLITPTTTTIHHRSYSRTVLVNESDDAAAKTKKTKKKKKGKDGDNDSLIQAARDFNDRRAAYRRQVSQLRKSYAAQVAEQNAADQAEAEELQRQLTRSRLERQRLKNIRSAQNALLEKERRAAREVEFQQYLDRQQEIRNAKNERLTAARQLVIDMLEEEAPLWLTTPAEVEAAFTPEAEQLLWSFPGGVFGAPNPSLDSHMWQHETHTWHMRKSYKTKRQVLLERIQEQAYNEANMDASFWTDERLAQRHELEQRARLRADVQNAGRRELLKRQAQMMDDRYALGKGDVPKAMPAPSLKMQADEKALEREGTQILMQHPERFFVFDKEDTQEQQLLQAGDDRSKVAFSDGAAANSGVLLGTPVALRSIGASEYPVVVGKLPKPDTRTEREKKQAERQERLLAAARAQALQDTTNPDEADDDWDDDPASPPIDYNVVDHDSDDEEWEKGLDPVQDKAILETPSDQRYTVEDIEWTLQQLEQEAQFHEERFAQEMENLQLKEKSVFELEHQKQGQQGDNSESELAAKDATIVHDDNDESSSSIQIETILLSMSDKELFALSDLDDIYTTDMSADEFTEAAQKIPSLTQEQLKMLMERERS